ncbi:MAG TPA: hypothetical protein VGM51_09305 [Armatimonadota bacterium]|jgi:Arc/MetJ family transcription regulator
MAVIELEVDDATARQIAAATVEERTAYGDMLADLLRERSDRDKAGQRLRQAMGELGSEAEAKGLTPEVLDDILRDG